MFMLCIVSKTACIKWNHVTFILYIGWRLKSSLPEHLNRTIYTVYCMKVPKLLAWNGIVKHYKYWILYNSKGSKMARHWWNPGDLAWSECLTLSLVSLSFQLNYITALCWFLIVCSFPQVLLSPKTEVQPFAVDQNLKSGLDSLLSTCMGGGLLVLNLKASCAWQEIKTSANVIKV